MERIKIKIKNELEYVKFRFVSRNAYAYARGYRSGYVWAAENHEGYNYILAVTMEREEENLDPDPSFIAGLRDGAWMGARDRGMK